MAKITKLPKTVEDYERYHYVIGGRYDILNDMLRVGPPRICKCIRLAEKIRDCVDKPKGRYYV